jgi:hypothetical protein
MLLHAGAEGAGTSSPQPHDTPFLPPRRCRLALVPRSVTLILPDDIKKGRASLDELATAAGRDPKTLDVTVFGEDSDREAIKRFEDAGADRVIVRLAWTVDESALTELERIAAAVR